MELAQLNLLRQPINQDPNLQAWDNADQYLLNYLDESDCNCTSALVLNDSFGALAIGLASQGASVLALGDSYLSELASKLNIAANGDSTLNISHQGYVRSQNPSTLSVDLCVIRVPKHKQLFIDQLDYLNEALSADSRVMVVGMDKHLFKDTRHLLEERLGAVQYTRGWKKARIWDLQTRKKKAKPTVFSEYRSEETELNLTALPNVFAAKSLDPGAHALLNTMDKWPQGRETVIDLGCGNGILGLSYLKQNPGSDVYFVDESYAAIESARLNVKQNQLNADKAHFVHANALTDWSEAQADIVLCNPPFHQEQTITTDIASMMFEQAKSVLKPDGVLICVANIHLGYKEQLSALFPRVKTQSSTRKFVVYQCRL